MNWAKSCFLSAILCRFSLLFHDSQFEERALQNEICLQQLLIAPSNAHFEDLHKTYYLEEDKKLRYVGRSVSSSNEKQKGFKYLFNVRTFCTVP